MTTSQTDFKLPPVIATQTEPNPLDSLRSPQLNLAFAPDDEPSVRDSVASIAVSEFNDIALDDESLDVVPLPPAATSPSRETSPSDPDQGDEARPSSPSPTIVDIGSAHKNHKKTASTTTIRSFHESGSNLLLKRLDLHDGVARNRGSVDGQLKLQEEFARLHEQEKKEHKVADGAIDWGGLFLLFNAPNTLTECQRFLGCCDFW